MTSLGWETDHLTGSMHYHQNTWHQMHFHVYVLSILSFVPKLYSPIDFNFETGVRVKCILCFVIHFYYFSIVKYLLCVSGSVSISVTENRKPRTKSLARRTQSHSRDRHCSLPTRNSEQSIFHRNVRNQRP